MKRKRMKNGVLLLMGLGFCFIGIQAQTSLNVKVKKGTETPFLLSNIAKLTFAIGNMTVNMKDASTSLFVISDVQNLNFELKTGIPQLNNDGNTTMSLYPIPALDVLNVQYSSATSGKAQFQIIDLSGKVVLQQTLSCQIGTNINTITVSHLHHGLYLCRLQQGTRLETTKFLKN